MLSSSLSFGSYTAHRSITPASQRSTPQSSPLAQPASVLQTQAPDSFQSTQAAIKTQSPQFGANRVDYRRHNMARHLQEGFNLIRAGRYEEAIRHLQNRQTLDSMGVGLQRGPLIFYPGIPADEHTAKSLVQQAAAQNMAFDRDGRLSIKFANIAVGDPASGQTPRPRNATEAAILDHLLHEQALMAVEENIHTYQNMSGGRGLSYTPPPGQETYDDHEIDIATTLERYGVPVTADFINRYQGRAAQIVMPEILDLVTYSDGTVERRNVTHHFRPAILNMSTSRTPHSRTQHSRPPHRHQNW